MPTNLILTVSDFFEMRRSNTQLVSTLVIDSHIGSGADKLSVNVPRLAIHLDSAVATIPHPRPLPDPALTFALGPLKDTTDDVFHSRGDRIRTGTLRVMGPTC